MKQNLKTTSVWRVYDQLKKKLKQTHNTLPFYILQVINNACATQAIVSVLLNCTHQDVHLGETLSEFKEFSQSFDAAVSSLLNLAMTYL